jgi:phosphoenolpyruvate-protein kinase (PTS system EI component)
MTGPERRLEGAPGAAGIVIGMAYVLADVTMPAGGGGGPDEQAKALAALQAVASRLGEAVHYLLGIARADEAAILEASQLMAEDPSLIAEVEALAASRPAAAALLEATEHQASLLAAIPDPYLAARAVDVRRLGKQAARLALAPSPQLRGTAPTPQPPPPCEGEVENATVRQREHAVGGASGVAGGASPAPTALALHRSPANGDGGAPAVLVAHDLGPTDLAEAELEGINIGGIALAEGSATSHAAIVARSWGVPLVVGLGEGALSVADGETVVVDGTAGTLVISPSDETVQQAEAGIERERARRDALARSRWDGAVTQDGHRIRLLVNASTEREVVAGLAAGAEGVGLLRTELAFLGATAWPDESQHEAALRSILRQHRHLEGKPFTVRTLDFGLDKTPPFLRDRPERGIALQLGEAGALEAQFRALLRAAADAGLGNGLRIMLPLVEAPEQVQAARRQLRAAHEAVAPEEPLPALGAMIETTRAVEQIEEIAAAADFLSIGTNDLVQSVLGLDRLTPAATVRSAADPRVLRAIGAVTAVARRRGLSVEVCGEAAGDPRIAVLLIGLGVSELSVAPARLDEVRAAVRATTFTRSTELAQTALTLDSAEAVLTLLDAALDRA